MFIPEQNTCTDTTTGKQSSKATITLDHETDITLVLPDGQKVIVKYKPNVIAGDTIEIKLAKPCATTCKPARRPTLVQEIEVQF